MERIKVNMSEAYRIRNLLSHEPKNEDECFGEDERIVYTAKFPDGCQMDIKVCGVQYEEGGCNRPWTEAVLFDKNGAEIGCSEPSDQFFKFWEVKGHKVLIIPERPLHDVSAVVSISTIHLMPETLAMLQRGENNLIASYGNRYENSVIHGDQPAVGVFIQVPECVKDLIDLPADLFTVLNWARQHHYKWINCDTDAAEVPELPSYNKEWDGYSK